MKIILVEEVSGLGEPGTIVDVAPGYARNYLVPRKLAVYANTGKAKELEHNKRRLERKRQQLAQAAKSEAERIDGQTLVIPAHVGEGGRLFGSVTTSQIAEALKAQSDVTVDRHKIHLGEPIRTVGEHAVEVRFIGDTRARIIVKVVDAAHPDGTPAEVQPEEAAPAAEAQPEAAPAAQPEAAPAAQPETAPAEEGETEA